MYKTIDMYKSIVFFRLEKMLQYINREYQPWT